MAVDEGWGFAQLTVSARDDGGFAQRTVAGRDGGDVAEDSHN